MDLIFRNTTIISDGLSVEGDLAVKNGVVRAVGDLSSVEGKEEIDCTGMLLLPGVVDLGVNLLDDGENDPESAAGFALATRDAAQGGVTTIISTVEMDDTEHVADTISAQSDADSRKALVDYGYHLLLNNWNKDIRTQCGDALAQGISSFWVARTGVESPLPSLAVLQAAVDGLPPDALIIGSPMLPAYGNFLLEKAQTKGLSTQNGWEQLCPDDYVAAYIALLMYMLPKNRARVLIRGIDTVDAVEVFAGARERNPSILGAVGLAPLLFSDDEDPPRTWPPIRSRQDQRALYNAIDSGLISAVISDHRPRTLQEIMTAAGDGKILPAGVATLSHFLPLLHSEGVTKWRLSLQGISLCACADPAKLAGLYPRKGSLQPGGDADVVVFNPNRERSTDDVSSSMELQFDDPIMSRPLQGAVEAVYLRGNPVYANGQLTESPTGQFLKRRMALE